MEKQDIIARLPYAHPFLFVEELSHIDENGVTGFYSFTEEEYFYAGHFKDQPVTPGVILIECMAQIGLVCLGIYLLSGKASADTQKLQSDFSFAFSETEVLFERPVFPGERLKVTSTRTYWRMGKLKCRVEAFNASGQRVAQGSLSGILRR